MKSFVWAGLATLAASHGVFAAGIDRSGQSVAVIFEAGNYFEASFGSVSPSVSGVQAIPIGTLAPGGGSGDMSPSYTQIGAAYKHSFGNGIDVALIFDQPFGASVDYPITSGYFASGSVADLASDALTAVVKYQFPSNVSVYGGVRYQTFDATATVPFVSVGPGVPGVVAPGAPYAAVGRGTNEFGYLLGAAYERPDIALRVALTYNSAVTHTLDTVETSAFGGPVGSDTIVKTPQSVNLEFQSGVATDTLVFGSVRWVDWSNFDITPLIYQTITGGSLVSYREDFVSYSLGVGRRLSDTWSVAATIGYETSADGFSSNLGPTNGNKSIGIGATYTKDNMEVTGGIRYVDIGNAQTTLGGGIAAADFSGNHAIGFGLKVGYSF